MLELENIPEVHEVFPSRNPGQEAVDVATNANTSIHRSREEESDDDEDDGDDDFMVAIDWFVYAALYVDGSWLSRLTKGSLKSKINGEWFHCVAGLFDVCYSYQSSKTISKSIHLRNGG